MENLLLLIASLLSSFLFLLFTMFVTRRPKKRTIRDILYDVQNTVEESSRDTSIDLRELNKKIETILNHVKRLK